MLQAVVVSVTEVATQASLRGCLKRLIRDQRGWLHVAEIKKMIRALLKSKDVMVQIEKQAKPPLRHPNDMSMSLPSL